MAEKKKYNSILVSGRKDETLTYSKFIKDEESGESVKESLDKKVNVTDKLETQQIKDGAITNEKMAADSVGNTNLQDGSVSKEKLEDGSITNEKLAENSITKDKLKDNTIGIEKLDPELRQTINAATGLPKDLVETIQNVDDTLKDHQRQLDDKQSQINDKQQQITANDEDISLLQTRSTQMEETIKSIAATGGASQATAVTYDNEKSKLTAVNIQSAVDEVVDKTSIKDEEGTVVETPFRVIENEEFIKAVVDSEDRVLYGIYRDTGKPYYPQNDMYHISQSEEFLWVILDAANHPLLGIQQDGTCWAAKAQWLDDIKAIKEALSSIDETLKTFQPKEDGKGLINLDVADSFFYISNDEYIIAVVDAENRILTGIKYDGEPYFPNHEMYSVITNEEWLYAIIDAENKVLGGFRSDDGHMIVGGIDISTSISDAIIDISDIKERTAHLSAIDNDEYLSVETDADGKVLGYTAPDGSHYLYKIKSETIPEEFKHIEDPEGRTEITTDEEGKVMSYRDADGKKHEHDMEVTNLEVSNLNLQGNSVSDIKTALIEDGFEVKTPIDWSDYNTNDGKYPLHLQEPRCALLNIITDIELQNLNKKGLPGAEQGKNYDVPCLIEFWDKQGNYFKKTAKISGQGNSSMMFPQKNIAIDMFDTETMDSAFSVKFGNWVSQDSYHLKAFYGDFIKGIGIVAYKIAMQAQKTRGIFKDVSWKSALIDERNQSSNPLHNTVSDLNIRMSEARCMPDGFPVMLYRNGEFYGIYAMCLKKHRNNYHMNKSTPEHIHLDGIISNSTILGGSVDWTQFEIRNPKGLYYKELHQGKLSYDSDYPGCFEIADEETVNSWIENGKLPDDTVINNKIQKQLKITAKVHKYVTELSSAYGKVNIASGIEEKKVEFNKYFDTDNLIDYLLINMALADGDGFGPNWQWTTWDGIKWYVNQYDKDNTCGYDSKAFFVHDVRNPMSWYGANVSVMKFIQSNYSEELKLRWKELVNAQILTKENIMNEIAKWTERIGYNNYDRHYNEKWIESPCSRDPAISANWKLESIVYSGDEGNYSNTSVYNAGDKCTIAQEMFLITFKCVKDGTIGVFPCKVYNFRPKYLGFYDSIWRLDKFISENLQAVNDFINKL